MFEFVTATMSLLGGTAGVILGVFCGLVVSALSYWLFDPFAARAEISAAAFLKIVQNDAQRTLGFG